MHIIQEAADEEAGEVEALRARWRGERERGRERDRGRERERGRERDRQRERACDGERERALWAALTGWVGEWQARSERGTGG